MLIGKDWKIESDPLNVTLYKKVISKKIGTKGKVSWRVEGYFATIKSALDCLVELEVKETEMKEFRAVSKKLDELHVLISNLAITGNTTIVKATTTSP